MTRALQLKAKHGNGNGAGMPLAVAAKLSASAMPTPTAGDAKASGSAGYSTASGRHSGTTLTDATVRWPTPTSRDWKDGACQSADVESNALLGRVALEGTTAGALNPDWVESLMGFPAGWTVTDGPQGEAPLSTNGKPRAPRKASRNGGTG